MAEASHFVGIPRPLIKGLMVLTTEVQAFGQTPFKAPQANFIAFFPMVLIPFLTHLIAGPMCFLTNFLTCLKALLTCFLIVFQPFLIQLKKPILLSLVLSMLALFLICWATAWK